MLACTPVQPLSATKLQCNPCATSAAVSISIGASHLRDSAKMTGTPWLRAALMISSTLSSNPPSLCKPIHSESFHPSVRAADGPGAGGSCTVPPSFLHSYQPSLLSPCPSAGPPPSPPLPNHLTGLGSMLGATKTTRASWVRIDRCTSRSPDCAQVTQVTPPTLLSRPHAHAQRDTAVDSTRGCGWAVGKGHGEKHVDGNGSNRSG